MIGRRGFLIGGTCSFIVSALDRAHAAGKVWRIGAVFYLPRAHAYMQGFVGRLRSLGYVEGQNLVIDYVQADENQAIDAVRALVQRGADLIFAPQGLAAQAAIKTTQAIPIVFALPGDPVNMGLAESLAHPGGNATGVSLVYTDLSAKCLQVMKELMPHLERLAVLWDPSNSEAVHQMHEAERAARALGLQLQSIEYRAPGDLAVVMEAAKQGRAQAVDTIASAHTFRNFEGIVSWVSKHRIPSIFAWKEAVEAGGLVSYGANRADNMRRAADYVDKIFRGAKPADLPIEQPIQFELVVNLKTAKALGMTVPESILLRADEVIR